MKFAKIAVAILAMASITALVGCGKSNSTTTTTQTYKVQRGNLIVSTTTTGNLAFTQTEDVAFEMAGTVEQVMIEEGDSVTKGEVMATLDTSAWDDQIKALEQAVTTAESKLSDAESNISSQELVVRQAQINLLSAQNTVAQIPAVKVAQELVDFAQAALTAAQGSYAVDPNIAGTQIQMLQTQLNTAKANLQTVLSGTNFNLSSDVSLQIAKAELSVDQNQLQLDNANRAVDSANVAKDSAEQAVQDAKDALQEVQGLSPTVTAPFAGIVTNVNVQGGQTVNKGAVAAQIADPGKFEVGVLVGETDISSIAIGGMATVSVDSLTGVTLPATVTAVAPTATIQQGVVNYKVTVEIQSTGPSTSGNDTNGFPGGGFPRGGTQTPGTSANQSAGSRFGNLPSGGSSFAVSQSYTLRQGLSVTVNLVTASKSNILTVPNRAIVRQQGKTYVEEEKNGKTEQVPVTIGISNSQYTEVTGGLSEGDTVIIQVTSSSSSTSSNQRQGGGLFPGGGGILR
jgi:HlyD family secretion protein